MKRHETKQKGLKERAPAEGPEVVHLEDKLTEITTHAAQSFKRWRRPLLIAAVMALVVYGVYLVIEWSRESRRDYFNQEIYELFRSPQALKQGYTLDTQRLENLLRDVQGDPAERMAVREAVVWYLEQADRERKTETIPGFQEAEGPISEEEARKSRAEALRIATEAAARHPGDTELELWASTVKQKIEGEVERAWRKDKRKYVPPAVLPGAAPGATELPGAAPGAAETPPQGSGPAAGGESNPAAPVSPSPPEETPPPEEKAAEKATP